MPMQPSGYSDSFARDRLPAAKDWPDFVFNMDDVTYPPRLNAAVCLLEGAIQAGHGDRVAIYSAAAQLTYRQLDAASNRLAHVIRDEMGLKTGERLLLHGPNSADMIVAWYAALKAGAIVVATMPLLRAAELAKVKAKADIRCALCADALAEAVEGAGFETIVRFGEVWEKAADKPGAFEACDTASDDVALLAFTSGTTGQPKACAHFHRAVLAMADTFAKHVLKTESFDVYAGTPPFAFTFGLGAFVVFPARAGAAVALPSKPGFEALCETIERYGVTRTFTAPTGYRAMMGLADRYDLSSLTGGVSAGEHLPEATWRAWKEMTGIELVDGIGATEMIHIFISASGDDIRPGATGKAVPGYEAKILAEDGSDAPDGETGRLAVRGPTGCLYLDDERQTKYVQEGWNVTGDLFRRDADGYFWYVSRADDMIVSSGYNIAGPEVEQALLTHEAVAECAVVGEPCEDRGMVVVAHVVARPGHVPGEGLAAELQAHVKAEIAPYKYPRRIYFADALPKTQTGKIQRFRLKAEETA